MKTTFNQNFVLRKTNPRQSTLATVYLRMTVDGSRAEFPKANPDFDNKIDKVRYWLLECDHESGIPEREIGIDDQGHVILKMPFKNNYGYWTDII